MRAVFAAYHDDWTFGRRLLHCLTALLCTLGLFAQARPGSRPTSERAQRDSQAGLKLAQNGDLTGAESQLRLAVDLEPSNPQYLYELASILRAENKPAEALGYSRRALRIDPNNIRIRRSLALALWDLGRPVESRSELRKIALTKPADESGVLILALVEKQLGNHAESEKLLGSISDWIGQHSDAVLALGRGWYQTGQKQKAAGTLGVLLRSRDVSPDAIFSAALLAAKANDLATSRQLLLEQTRRQKADGRTYNLLGHVFQNEGKLTEAVEAFDRAIAREPSVEEHYLDLARALAEYNQWRAALEAARKAVITFPDSEALYEIKGFAENVLLLTSEAMKSYSRALEIDPRSARANLGLGVAQRAAGMTRDAAATFERGIEQFPQDALHYQEYGLMLLKQAAAGDAAAESRAIALLEKALALSETLLEAHYELGNVLLKRGDIAQALPHLERAIQLEPNLSKVHYAVAHAYQRAGRPADAAREMQLYSRLKETEEKLKKATGAAITEVTPGSPAQKAGLKAGDVIMEANGKPVADMNDFHLQMSGVAPGATVMLTVLRGDRRLEIPVKVGETLPERGASSAQGTRR